MTYKIKHSIPGRVRFTVSIIGGTSNGTRRIRELLSSAKGVTGARVNPACASLVVHFDKRQTDLNAVAETLGRAISRYGKTAENDSTSGTLIEPETVSVKAAARRFAGLTATGAVMLAHNHLFKQAAPRGMFSPLPLITSAFALPMVFRGLGSLKSGRVDLDAFLGGSVLAATCAGDSPAALEILWITGGGELLKAWLTDRSRRSIRRILSLTSRNTYVLKDGNEVEIPVDRVSPGDTVAVHTGEKISVDGIVTGGEAVVDESPVNGRSEPAHRKEGDRVFAGTFVKQGVIFVRAGQVGDKTYLSRVLAMVEDAFERRAGVEEAADLLARRMVKLGCFATLGTLLVTADLRRAFTVLLVMGCPCATVLAASTAVSAAVSRCAGKNILVKGGRYLEAVGRADTICFDKTGTLTTGNPSIRKFKNFSSLTEEEILTLTVSAESHNPHPVALSIRTEAERRGIEPIPHGICDYVLGKGVRSEINGEEILVGSPGFMKSRGIDTEIAASALGKYRSMGLTCIFTARDKELLSLMAFADRERNNLEKVVNHLRADGIEKIAIITGDEHASAHELARRLSVDDCRASIMPDDKADVVRSFKASGRRIIMVGDGINDAPALAEADIGIAMGAGGSEVAVEAADIALVGSELSDLVFIRSLSHRTLAVIGQNFWLATGTNLGGALLGAMGLLSPVGAGLIHIVHTLGVMANSGRLLYHDLPDNF